MKTAMTPIFVMKVPAKNQKKMVWVAQEIMNVKVCIVATIMGAAIWTVTMKNIAKGKEKKAELARKKCQVFVKFAKIKHVYLQKQMVKDVTIMDICLIINYAQAVSYV